MAAFQTPQTGGGGGQRRELQHTVSLLFTPTSLKGTDGQKGAANDYRSATGLGRSPGTTPGGFGGRGGEGPTPRSFSRRRSMTPPSGQQREAPPPPPADSLLESPTGLGMGPSSAWGQAQPEAGGAEDMVLASPPGVTSGQQQQRESARPQPPLQALEDTWVTVWGFGPDQLPLVVREFAKCGDIQQFGTFGELSQVNWVHILYASRHAAQRALLRSGDQLSTTCMVGVKPIDPSHRGAVERGEGGGGEGSSGLAMSFPKPAPQLRPYTLDAAAAASTVVPLPARGTWSKIQEFVLGL